MKTFHFGIQEMPAYLEQVDKKLHEQAPKYIAGTKRMLEARGKRLRPSFVLAVAHCSGKQIDERVIHAAAAVELVHLSSLIHDDIMDNGTLRWGQPTINTKEGMDAAILAGDYLLAKGCKLAAQVSAEAAEVLADTITALCEGQALELLSQFDTERSQDALQRAVRGKTSALFMASLQLGGLVSGLDVKDVGLLKEFAENYGFAFQYIDDVQDFVQSPDAAGKSVGNDVREGNYTLPVILSLQGHNGPTLKRLLKDRVDSPHILEILETDKSLDFAAKEAEKYKQQALASLGKLGNDKLAAALTLSVTYF